MTTDINARAGAALIALTEAGAIPSRWRDGMQLLAVGSDGQEVGRRYSPRWDLAVNTTPDTSDTLTRRALLDVIREVTGEPLIYLFPHEHADGLVSWAVLPPKLISKTNLWVHHALHGTWSTTEAEALVNALEALATALPGATP